MAAKRKRQIVCRDHNSRTCLQVDRTNTIVKFIPMFTNLEGFRVHETSPESFDQRYKPLQKYPIEKACELYKEYALSMGASEEALNYLGQIIEIPKEDYEMARKKAVTFGGFETEPPAEDAPKTRRRRTKAAPEVEAPAKGKAAPKAKAKAPAKGKAAKADTGGRASAASRFQELIMRGKLTDADIFATVQAEFGLDDKKRSYVSWYRNYLRKQGMNPPDPK